MIGRILDFGRLVCLPVAALTLGGCPATILNSESCRLPRAPGVPAPSGCLPDLVARVRTDTLPSCPVSLASNQVAFDVLNQGLLDAGPSRAVLAFHRQNLYGPVYKYLPVPPLQAGQKYQAVVAHECPFPCDVVVNLDVDSQVQERDEGNEFPLGRTCP